MWSACGCAFTLALQAYVETTSSPSYNLSDPIRPLDPCLHVSNGSPYSLRSTLPSRCLDLLPMASYYNGSLVPIQSIKVGPIRVVAASTAIDKGLPIDCLTEHRTMAQLACQPSLPQPRSPQTGGAECRQSFVGPRLVFRHSHD